MIYLKRAWNLWSDLITFEWLERLSRKHPRLAGVIRGALISLLFGLGAWYHLNPRFVIYPKHSHLPLSWAERIPMGILFSIASVITIALTVRFVKLGPLKPQDRGLALATYIVGNGENRKSL